MAERGMGGGGEEGGGAGRHDERNVLLTERGGGVEQLNHGATFGIESLALVTGSSPSAPMRLHGTNTLAEETIHQTQIWDGGGGEGQRTSKHMAR